MYYFKLEFSLDICPGVGLQDLLLSCYLQYFSWAVMKVSWNHSPLLLNSSGCYFLKTPSHYYYQIHIPPMLIFICMSVLCMCTYACVTHTHIYVYLYMHVVIMTTVIPAQRPRAHSACASLRVCNLFSTSWTLALLTSGSSGPPSTVTHLSLTCVCCVRPLGEGWWGRVLCTVPSFLE